MKRMVFAAVALLACGGAAAQDLGGVPVKPGQQVRVTDDTGARVTGPLVSISHEAMRVGNQEFASARVTKIERRGDRLWNGILIGAAVGAGLSQIPNEACMDNTRAECIGLGIESGVLMGLIVDLLHRGYTTVYRGAPRTSARVTPIVDRHARGASVKFSW